MLNVVIRLSSLGDIVLTSAFIKSLEGPVLFVTKDEFKSFVEEFMPHRELKTYGISKPPSFFGWFREGLAFARFLGLYIDSSKQTNVKLYDLHNVTKSNMFLWGLKWGLEKNSPRVRLTALKTKKHRFKRWLKLIFKISSPDLKATPVFKRHLQLLDTPSKSTPTLINDRKLSLYVNGDRELNILVAPDAQHRKKVWPEEYWHEFLSRINEVNSIKINVKVVAQKKLLTNIEKYFKNTIHRLEDLQGKTSLLDLAPIASNSHICICGNSAWLHISEAVGTPVISFAGPIAEEFGFSPWMPQSKELKLDLKCRPCSFHGQGSCYNPKQMECMRGIKPQDLYAQLWLNLGYRSAPE